MAVKDPDGGPDLDAVCSDVATTVALFDVPDVAGLEERIDARLELDAIVETADDVGHAEPHGLDVVINSSCVVELRFPFTVGDLWDAVFEADEDTEAELNRLGDEEAAQLLVENGQTLAAHVAATWGPVGEWARWPGGWPGDIEAALIDAVFSANALYRGPRGGGIQPKVVAWRTARDARRTSRDLDALIAEIEQIGPRDWAVGFGNSQPSPGRPVTAPGGLSKAATVLETARLLVALEPAVRTAETITAGREGPARVR